jgi:LacI family transcriptional regulator
MAMGAYDALKEMGLSIPADVAVIGFDNREVIAAHMRPPLTTIALPYYEMGKWAMEYLVEHSSEEQSPEPVQATLACPLVERESV